METTSNYYYFFYLFQQKGVHSTKSETRQHSLTKNAYIKEKVNKKAKNTKQERSIERN